LLKTYPINWPFPDEYQVVERRLQPEITIVLRDKEKTEAHFFSLGKGWIIVMNISRRLGILVFSAVPAIVGGGIVMAIFDSLTVMWIYEVLLLITAGALVSR
jgi:hypothetical protein